MPPVERYNRVARRVRAHGWTNVHLLEADAVHLDPGTALEPADRDRVDAVLCTYALSPMADPHAPPWTLLERRTDRQDHGRADHGGNP